MSHSHAAQWPRFEAPRLTGFNMPARFNMPIRFNMTVRFEVSASLIRAIRTTVEVGAAVTAVVGFAGVMWLLVAGPGVLDGRSSTVEHAPLQTAMRQAAR